jgi:hypothetical protein
VPSYFLWTGPWTTGNKCEECPCQFLKGQTTASSFLERVAHTICRCWFMMVYSHVSLSVSTQRPLGALGVTPAVCLLLNFL